MTREIPENVMDAAREHTAIYINPSRGAEFEYAVQAVACAIRAERARCAYLVMIEADDYWDKHRLAAAIRGDAT